jgi:hypothetical protein
MIHLQGQKYGSHKVIALSCHIEEFDKKYGFVYQLEMALARVVPAESSGIVTLRPTLKMPE